MLLENKRNSCFGLANSIIPCFPIGRCPVTFTRDPC